MILLEEKEYLLSKYDRLLGRYQVQEWETHWKGRSQTEYGPCAIAPTNILIPSEGHVAKCEPT